MRHAEPKDVDPIDVDQQVKLEESDEESDDEDDDEDDDDEAELLRVCWVVLQFTKLQSIIYNITPLNRHNWRRLKQQK